MIDELKLEAAQAEVNQKRRSRGLPAAEFITIEFCNGFVTIEAEYYRKLSKAKQKG